MLDGIGQGVALNDLNRLVGGRFLSDPTMSPRVLLDLAAEAFVACQVSRGAPLELEGLDRRLLPEWPAREVEQWSAAGPGSASTTIEHLAHIRAVGVQCHG